MAGRYNISPRKAAIHKSCTLLEYVIPIQELHKFGFSFRYISRYSVIATMMASHSLAIAKASLAAGMIRPDPTSISKAEIARFHFLLEAVLKQCSSANIQV